MPRIFAPQRHSDSLTAFFPHGEVLCLFLKQLHLEVLKQNMGDRAPGLSKSELSVTASSVQDAVESGDYLAQVDALRVRIAMAMDDPKTPPAALAPLSRQLQELTREREAHFTQAREERLQLVVPDDEPFDPDDI